MQYQTKHLSLVESLASDANSTLGSVYGSAKDKALNYSPGFVSTVVSNLENICNPLMDFGKKTSMNLLLCADTGVDNGMTIVNSTASYSRKTAARVVGEERLKPVDNFVSNAQKTVNDGVETVKSKGVFGAAQDGLHTAVDGVQHAGSYAKKTVLEVNQTVGNGASAVKEKLDPALQSAYNKWLVPAVNNTASVYTSLHDSVVRTKAYATVHSLTTSTASYLWGYNLVRMPFELSREYLYPAVQPVADPFVKRFGPYVKDIKKHLKPQADPVPVVDVTRKKAKSAKREAKQTAQKAEQNVNGAARDMTQ